MSWSGLRTIVVLELRQRVRATRWQVMLAAWGTVLLLMVLGLGSAAVASGADLAGVAPLLYDTVLCFVLGVGLIVAPTLSATSVNGDRADATLALVQATALRSREIAVGKLVAAWLAAIAFLAVALPFLVVLAGLGGASWQVLLGHLLVLVVTLGAVCGIGLGFSSLAARTSASAVLTYLAVATLVVGTPIVLTAASAAVRDDQTVVHYRIDYGASTATQTVCAAEPSVRTDTIFRTERIWWMVAPNPFAALSDVSARESRTRDRSQETPLAELGQAVSRMRVPSPSQVVYDDCSSPSDPSPASAGRARTGDATSGLPPFWPATLLVLLVLGCGATETASRELAVPAGHLARGIRMA